MTYLIVSYLIGLALVLAGLMLYQYHRRTRDLLSIRNLFLGGFIIFQISSPCFALLSGGEGRLYVSNLEAAGLQFAGMATVFLVVFLITYERGWGMQRLALHMPRTNAAPSGGVLLFIAVLLTVVAVGLRLGVYIPYISTLSSITGAAMGVIACGMAAWVWAQRLQNPVVAVCAIGIIVANVLLLLTGTFGRRGLVSIGAVLVWAMYFANWRYQRNTAALARLALATIIPLIIVAAFTTIREGQAVARDRGPIENVRLMVEEANVTEGLLRLSRGQDAGVNSMWMIEQYPDRFEYRHLHSVVYFFVYPVPRELWPDKPWSLSFVAVWDEGVQNVGSAFNIGPGLIGHAAAEGGWYAAIVYALLLGLAIRFVDNMVWLGYQNPFIVLAVGSALGQILALARGELGVFAWIYAFSVVVSWCAMFLLSKLVEKGMGQQAVRADTWPQRPMTSRQ